MMEDSAPAETEMLTLEVELPVEAPLAAERSMENAVEESLPVPEPEAIVEPLPGEAPSWEGEEAPEGRGGGEDGQPEEAADALPPAEPELGAAEVLATPTASPALEAPLLPDDEGEEAELLIEEDSERPVAGAETHPLPSPEIVQREERGRSMPETLSLPQEQLEPTEVRAQQFWLWLAGLLGVIAVTLGLATWWLSSRRR